jgi:hypothetical protein
MTENLAEITEDFVISLVVGKKSLKHCRTRCLCCFLFDHITLHPGKDAVTRLSIPAVLNLRDEMFDYAQRCNLTKLGIYYRLLFSRDLKVLLT